LLSFRKFSYAFVNCVTGLSFCDALIPSATKETEFFPLGNTDLIILLGFGGDAGERAG